MEIRSLTEASIDENDTIRALIYGKPGAGKTELFGSFPKPILVFDWDFKLKPLYGQEGIDVISYDTPGARDCSKAFNQFMKDLKEAKKDEKYKTFAIDGISALDSVSLKHFMIQGGKDVETEPPTLPVYGAQSSWYITLFSMILPGIQRQFNKNIVVTAHEMYFIEEESKVHNIAPLITGNKIVGKLPGMFEEVWYIEREGGKEDKRILHTKPWKKAIATSTLLKESGIVLPALGTTPNAYETIINKAKKGS